MNNITLAQREALDVVKDMLDKSNTSVPEFGTKILTLILGILNIDCRVEHTITQIDGDKLTPIIPDNGNDKIQIPDWIKNVPTPPFSPHDPFPPKVWYNQEPESTKIDCTHNKNGIVYTSNNTDVRYTGDFKDGQTSFNDK